MYQDKKVIVCTAAGRRRYMQYLIPFILRSEIVDRYDIWINTHNGADIEFFKQLKTKCTPQYAEKINLVWQPDGVVDGISSINAFYKQCIEEDTIYFKIDDDVVWMEPNAIENMVKFRVEHPEYFLVSPLVINNATSTYLLQVTDKIKLNAYYNSHADGAVLWRNDRFAAELHQWFLDKKLKTGTYTDLHCGVHPQGIARFSINAILWFGSEMKRFEGVVPGDDEEFLSCIYPAKNGLANCFNGNVLVSHFAFYPQRAELDRQCILEQYGEYLHQQWAKDPIMKGIDDAIQGIMKDVAQREAELMQQPSPYKQPEVVVAPVDNSAVARIYKMLVPKKIREAIYDARHKEPEETRFIVEN